MTGMNNKFGKTGPMELLAPAGSRAAFEAAVRGGADAVYAGAPGLNARNLARDFTLEEIGAMCRAAHAEQVKFYIAMNSLMREEEIPAAVELLARFAAMGVDALIVQDLGILRLARRYFPELRLHASTLLGGHNSMTVRQFAVLGFSRVVLARELSLPEIRTIRQSTGQTTGEGNEVELEVFVHGALCFSFSGLCLCSSYLGGKSSMRGHCVQPCRRRYTWPGGGHGGGPGRGRGKTSKGRGPGKEGGGAGYLFSMNDLCAIELLPELRQAGVASLKIEGRLRSARYVESVVKAYRLALDGLQQGEAAWPGALEQAMALLERAMGRRTTRGYFQTSRPEEIISPYHSGNIGLFLGRVEAPAKSGPGREGARLTLRREVAIGDRLRLHQERGGERLAFTLKGIGKGGQGMERAATGDVVVLEVPAPVRAGDSLYKVDTREGRALEAEMTAGAKVGAGERRKRQGGESGEVRRRIERVMSELGWQAAPTEQPPAVPARPAGRGGQWAGQKAGQRAGQRAGIPANLEIWLKSDDPGILRHELPVTPARLLLVLDKESLAGFNRLRNIPVQVERRLVWSLPPVIRERDTPFFVKAIEQLSRRGFRSFQLGHVGQLELFGRRRGLFLIGDYTLNVANSQAVLLLRELSMQRLQLTIEADRQLVAALGLNFPGLGMTVYGTPPLFTAWLTGGHLKEKRTLISPKDEPFTIREARGLTHLLPSQPFSLLPFLPELQAMGVRYAVIDMSHGRPPREIGPLLETLVKGGPWKGRLSTFSYGGTYR